MKASRVLKRKQDRIQREAAKKTVSGKRYDRVKEQWYKVTKPIKKYTNRKLERQLARELKKDDTK